MESIIRQHTHNIPAARDRRQASLCVGKSESPSDPIEYRRVIQNEMPSSKGRQNSEVIDRDV